MVSCQDGDLSWQYTHSESRDVVGQVAVEATHDETNDSLRQEADDLERVIQPES